jgi:predicted hydrolase (HD superfamily)
MGIQLNISTKESKELLKRHVNSKTNLVIIFEFASVVQAFAQEISTAVLGYWGTCVQVLT